MRQLLENIFAVEVPDDVSAEGYTYNRIYTGDGEYEFHSWPYNELPPVKTGLKKDEYFYELQTNQYTEAQAARIVEQRELIGEGNYCYVNYNFEYDRIAFFISAIESMYSLLQSQNLDPNKNYLLLRKIR